VVGNQAPCGAEERRGIVNVCKDEWSNLNLYNLHTQVYLLAKFWLHIVTAFGVTERLICTASIGKINYRRFLNGCNL